MSSKQENDLISIIIPCYNSACYIRKCVESLFAQTYRNFEIIVVDDGSTDSPETALSGINDKRFRGVLKMPHQGVSTARNIGLSQAVGTYIIFIDGDDWIETNHIELLVNGLQHADCTITMMQMDYPNRSEINSDCLKLAESYPLINSAHFNLLFENYLLSSPCNKIYKARLLKQVNFLQFDGSISYAEDLLFNLEYFRMIKSVTLMPDATYHYVKHGESGTGRYHQNTAYTLSCISTAVTRLFGAKLNCETLTVLMRHYLWGLINLHHKGSNLNDSQTLAEISQILSIPEYRKAFKAISHTGISKNLQRLLRSGSPALIHYALKYLRQ